MKKFFLSLLILVVFASELLLAQDVFVPYLRFRCDNNAADKAFISEPGQFAGGWHYADGTGIVQYHFKLSDFEDVSAAHELFFRVFLWNEFVVKISDYPITTVDEGELVAVYSDDPANNPEHDAGNQQWLDISLQEYIDFVWDDIYISFFDGRPEDGWGPSMPTVGIYYLDDQTNIPDNNVSSTLIDLENITADGNTSEWPSENEWVLIQDGSENVVTTGTVSSASDLSATASVSFDKENIFFAADVTDDDVVIDGDKVIFYVGMYSIDANQTQLGHRAVGGVTGYRNRNEPDYRIEVDVNESVPVIRETKIVDGELADAEVSVVKTATGYTVEAKVPYYSLFIQDSVSGVFSIAPTNFPGIYNVDNVEIPYVPFAFKIEDFDGSSLEGSLITGTDENVDDSPSSWAYKTEIRDMRSDKGGEEVPKGYVKNIAVGGDDDQPFMLDGYTGSGASGSHRWADNSDTLAYKFNISDLEQLAPGVNLNIELHVWSEYVVQVSGSPTGEKTTIATWSANNIPVHDGSNPTDVAISLKDMRTLGFEDLYIWLTDGRPEDGWGPSINRISVFYTGTYHNEEIASFTPGTTDGDNDAAYLVADNNSSGRESHRFVDNDQSFGYKLNLAELQAAQPTDRETELFFNVWIRGQYVITVGEDENTPLEDQDTVAIWSTIGLDLRDGSNLHWEEQSLQAYVDAGWESVVFFYYDGLPENGWGGDLWGATITYREILGYYYFDEFTPGLAGSSELDYIVSGHEGSGNDDSHRWADGESEIAYKFNKAAVVAASGGYEDILFQVRVGNEFIISVGETLDGARTDTLYIWDENGMDLHDESNMEVRDINLKDYFDLGWEDVYVFFNDGIPTTGWGPSLRWAGLSTVRTVTDVEQVEGIVPTEFALEQNYPNPFNPSTVITYSLPKQGTVTLKVYDLLGREVKTLINDFQNSGSYKVNWNGDNEFGYNVASGVYFYRMMYNNKMQLVKKMLLVR